MQKVFRQRVMAITTAARERRRGITERQWQVCPPPSLPGCLVAAVAVAVEEGVASVSVTCWTLVDIEIIRAHVSVTPVSFEGGPGREMKCRDLQTTSLVGPLLEALKIHAYKASF